MGRDRERARAPVEHDAVDLYIGLEDEESLIGGGERCRIGRSVRDGRGRPVAGAAPVPIGRICLPGGAPVKGTPASGKGAAR